MVVAKAHATVVNGRLQVSIDLQTKGDLPGHPFRGNQWSSGGRVQVWKGNDFASAEDQSPEQIASWVKPGHVVVEETDGPMHQTFDPNSPVTFRTRKIGAELPQGTVVDKRLVHGEDGIKIEYLVKPRTGGKESEFQDRQELEKLETLLKIDPDAPSEDRQRWRQQATELRAKLESQQIDAKPKPKPKPNPKPEEKPVEKPKPQLVTEKPKPKPLEGLDLLRGQLRTLEGLIDRGARGNYAQRAEELRKRIAEEEGKKV